MSSLENLIKKYPNKKNGLIIEIKHNSEAKAELFKITSFLDKQSKISERIYCVLNKITKQPICTCGNSLKFLKLNRGYYKTCGNEKCISNIRSKNAIEINNNVDHEIISKKIKKTNLEKYGYACIFSSKNGMRETHKKTMKEKYGVNYALQNKDILQKQQNTTIQRHGTLNMFDLDKVKKTIQTKYKVNHPMKNKDVIKKMSLKSKQTKIEWVKDKLDQMECDYISGFFYDISFRCRKCGNISTENSRQTINRCFLDKDEKYVFKKSPCEICYPHNTFRSNFEKSVALMVADIYKNEVHLNRKYLGTEVDIIIPDKKIAIECNGLYWHSDLYKDKDYHRNKKILIEGKGYNLITIWEDDWYNLDKRKIIISRLSNKLNLISNKIYARKCVLKEVMGKEAKDFLSLNHLSGYTPSTINIGLFYNDELVYINTFRKGRKGIGKIENSYELIRSCSKLNYSIVGGFSKLIKFFVNNYSEDLYSFADCDWSSLTNDFYEKNGFTFLKHTSPGYWWANDKRYHRSNFMKYKLVNEGEDSNKTADEIMRGRKFFKIWNSGNLKYKWHKKKED